MAEPQDPTRESEDGLGHPSCCGCSRTGGVAEGSMCGKNYLLQRGVLMGKVPSGLLPPSILSCLCIPVLPQSLAVLVPWPGVKGQSLPCYPAPSTTRAQPPPWLSVNPPRPLPSSLSSMSLTEKQMDLLTS